MAGDRTDDRMPTSAKQLANPAMARQPNPENPDVFPENRGLRASYLQDSNRMAKFGQIRGVYSVARSRPESILGQVSSPGKYRR